MKSKIEARTDYEDEVYNKPIKLIEAIKEHALNYEESRYKMSTILDSMRAFLNCRQKDKEVLQDYTKRFKVAREVMQSHLGGVIILQKFVETMPGYDANDEDKQKELTKKADEQLSSFIYLVNSDQRKYGSVIKGLHSQKALQNNQYPRSIIEENSVLSTHRFDFVRQGLNNNQNDSNRTDSTSRKEDESTERNEDESPYLSFAQLEGKCYCCGKPGHKSPDCYQKNKIPREEWAINKTQMANIVQEKDNEDEKEVEPKKEKHIGWARVHYMFAQDKTTEEEDFERNLKKLVLLDTDSNATIFCEREYVTDVWDVNESMGVGTNGNGQLISNQKCMVPDLGEYWFNADSMTNIIAMKDMTSKYRVTMDSAVEKALFVHMKNTIVVFKQLENNLYDMDPRDLTSYITKKNYESKNVQMMNLVEDNLEVMSERQKNRAKAARKAYQAIGTPTTQDFKAMIRMNLIKNNRVTTKDVILAEKAFGPDVGELKGKTTRRKPRVAIDNVVEIPPELLSINEEVTLSIDGLSVNGLKFLTTISHDIMYRTTQYIQEARAEDYEKYMNEIYHIY